MKSADSIRTVKADPRLLSMLVCPQTHSPLHYDDEKQELISARTGLAFPVRNGIPIMLLDQARSLDESEKAALKASKSIIQTA